mmetsp:Transcript_10732/g.20227  ORF Transcript_10732/g.20227 Transcript_10732/m.20227 type:complete len:663 (-) Transcript_10732:505-2493(-)
MHTSATMNNVALDCHTKQLAHIRFTRQRRSKPAATAPLRHFQSPQARPNNRPTLRVRLPGLVRTRAVLEEAPVPTEMSEAAAPKQPPRASKGASFGSSRSWLETEKYSTYVGREEAEFGYPRDFDVRYELLEQIGRGGYGVVWLARCRQTGLKLAVKKLDKSSLNTHGQLDRVRREVLFQAKMGPSLSVAYLYRVFEDEDAVYMVMELCAGGPMWNRIRDEGGHYTEARAATMLRAALQAVAQCHARGIILRDVKPHNFLFLSAAEDSPLKVTDFGLAEDFDPLRPEEEPFEERVGTSLYMAPEVVGRLTTWPPKVQYGPKADVWSLGVVAYQLLCGRLPFRTAPGRTQDKFTSSDAFAAITLGAFDFDNEAWRNLSPGARDFVQSLLQVESSDRPTARAALRHKWLRNGVAQDAPLGDNLATDVVETFEQRQEQTLQYLQRYGGYSHLKQAALQEIVQQHVMDSERAQEIRSVFEDGQEAPCTAQTHNMTNEATDYSEGCDFEDNEDEDDFNHKTMSSKRLLMRMSKMGHELSPLEAKRLLQSIDVQRRGHVDLPSFVAAMCNWQELQQDSRWDEWVEDAFKKFDTSEKGFLDSQAVESLLTGDSSPRFSSQVVQSNFKQIDTNNDGVISFDEFKVMLETDDTELDDYDPRHTINRGVDRR